MKMSRKNQVNLIILARESFKPTEYENITEATSQAKLINIVIEAIGKRYSLLFFKAVIMINIYVIDQKVASI